MTVDYLPLIFLVVVVVGALVVFRYMARLKRAALQTLAEVRKVEAQLAALRATTASLQASAEAGAEPGDPVAPPSPDAPPPS